MPLTRVNDAASARFRSTFPANADFAGAEADRVLSRGPASFLPVPALDESLTAGVAMESSEMVESVGIRKLESGGGSVPDGKESGLAAVRRETPKAGFGK